MLAAARLLAARGELTAAPGRGLLVNLQAVPGRPAAPAAVRHCRSELLASVLRRDLLSGAFLDDSLLAVTALARRYGVFALNMGKALRALAAERALAFRRGRYALSSPSLRPHATILLLARGTDERAAGVSTPLLAPVSSRTQENLRSLEHYCTQHGIHLQHVPCVFDRSTVVSGVGPTELEGLLRSRAVVGAMLWTMALPEHWAVTTVQRLCRAGLRVAVLDEVAELRNPEALAALPGVRCYRFACDAVDGLVAGRWLLRAGHRRAAFITGWPEQPWSANRHRGVVMAFAESGLDGGVQLHASSELEDTGQQERVLADVRATLDRALVTRVRHADGEAAGAVAVPPLFDDLRTAVMRGLLRRRLEPVFESAFRRGDATVWVGANDDVALQALEFLRRHRAAVPERVSVMGFDDTAEAAYRGLTSFNFAGPALVRAMAGFVVSGTPVNPRSALPYHAEGFVVERTTTRAVQGAKA